MQREQQVEEIKILMDLIAHKTTSLADDVMTIDVAEYTDNRRFELEKKLVFRDYAQFVGPSCAVAKPGDYIAFDDTSVPILVVRQIDMSLKAFVNICSHRGAPLNANDCGTARNGRIFTCPYHGWTYNIEGTLIGVPFGNEGFDSINRDALNLRTLDVQERYGMIFVMPNPDMSFNIETVLSGLQQRLSGFGLAHHCLFGTKQVFTEFSWKLNMDTFHEYYHFESLHPDSIAKMAYSNIAHYRQYGRNHSMSSPTLAINDLKNIPEDQWKPMEYSSYVNFIFPNTVIFVVDDHFQTWRVYPINAERSVVYHSMFLPEEPATANKRQHYEEYFQMINDIAVNEDYALAHKISRGMKAGIKRNVLVGRNEPGVQNMHRQLHDIIATHENAC